MSLLSVDMNLHAGGASLEKGVKSTLDFMLFYKNYM